MTDQLSGRVTSVESIRQGVIATAWTGSQMTVLNAADIDRSGCDLTPDDGATLYHCTGDVVDGDESDTITMDSVPPADWPTGGTDEDGQAIPTEVRLDLWPEVLDVVAMVDLGDGEVLPVTVPHALRPLLSDGLRDPETMEQVVCSRQGTGWVIDDVIGLRAQVGMDGLASQVIETIQAAAASGVRRWDSINEPDVDGQGSGDIWFRHDVSLTGTVTGQWHWDGTAWIRDQIADTVLANIDAGKIVGGTLSGLAGIFSPAPSSLPRTQIVGSTISVIRAGTEGEEVSTVQLGGATDDQLMISDADGAPLGGIGPDGDLLAQDANVNGTLMVGGTNLMDMMTPLPRGIIARQKLGSTSALNSIYVGGTELGLLELSADLYAGREYEFFVGGNVQTSAAGNVSLRVRATTAALGSTPDAPTITSPGLRSAVIPCQSGNQEIGWSKILPVQTSDVSARILLTAQTSSVHTSLRFNTSDTLTGDIMITDRGSYGSWGDGAVSNGGGNPFSGTSTDPSSTNPTKTYTSSWAMNAWRAWRGSGTVSNYLQQGYYGGYQRYSVLLWGSNPSSAMSGYKKITGMWLYIKNASWYSFAGGTLRLGHYDATALPGSPQKSGGGAVSVAMKPGQGLWIGLPGGWWDGIASGNIRGFTLGEGANTSGTYYGKFQPSGVVLKATYSK